MRADTPAPVIAERVREGFRRSLLLLALLTMAGCGSRSRDRLVAPAAHDAGSVDATAAADSAAPDARAGTTDAPSAKPCDDDLGCDDGVRCTFDRCDRLTHTCRNVPDDSVCDDGAYCNGRERCDAVAGCVAGATVSCSKLDPCELARCVEATKSCAYAPRDVDGDGDPDEHCAPKHDCNDLDPTVASTFAEICGNGKDDNCDGLVDESPCLTPAGDSCASALALTTPGTLVVATAGTRRDYGASCGVASSAAARDVVVRVTVPTGSTGDLELWARAAVGEVSLSLEGACGDAATELACAATPGSGATRLRARAIAPGDYYVIVATQGETTVSLRAELASAAPRPTNETCTSAAPIALGTPFAVSLVDPSRELPSACAPATGELTYAFTLSASSDVRVTASTILGDGAAVLSLRTSGCASLADELRCGGVAQRPLVARSLPAGSYVLAVAATAPIDATVVVAASPPTSPAADQRCDTATELATNAWTTIDLSNSEAALRDGCVSGQPSAAYALTLGAPSDVLLVGRFNRSTQGFLAFDGPTCDVSTLQRCAVSLTPVRLSRRNVLPGSYRVTVGDPLARDVLLGAYVRDAVPPTVVTGADRCADALVIPPDGGYFTGDTTAAGADFRAACDAPFQSPERDQVLRLDLAQKRRVLFDMSGSVYTTILDLRAGAACPGTPVTNGCSVGFVDERSFLDVTLDAGIYWVLVSGYSSGFGPWNLDVRVLAP